MSQEPGNPMLRGLRLLERLPLRYRLLAAPVLGLVLILVVSSGLLYEAQRQNVLVTRIMAQDLARLDRYTALFVSLSEQHTAIFDLLHDAQHQIDEATLYLRAKRVLDRVGAAAAGIERENLRSPAPAGGAESAALRQTLAERARNYSQAAKSAVELASVDIALAGSSLGVANERYISMNRAFTRLLDSARRAIDAEIEASVALSRERVAGIVTGGLLLATLVLALSLWLSRRLTRSLELQLQVFAELGEAAGAPLDPARGQDEIARIENAIATFGNLLLKVKEHERALLDANRDLLRARDDLEKRVAERTRELSAANEELHIFGEVVRSTGEAVAITRPDGTIIDVNPAFEQVTGYPRAEVLGTRLYQNASALEGSDAPGDLWERVRAQGGWSGELLDRRKSGEVFPWWVTINAVRDLHGQPVHMVSVSRDVTELKRNEQQLQKLAFYDPLTGLANRALLADRLKMALSAAKRGGSILAVIYVDLDRFKYVNDTLGHPAGDQLLIEIARRLSAPLRTSDTVARMGGDEFAILLTNVNAEGDAVNIAERIIDAVAKQVTIGDDTVFVGASVGVSFYPRDGQDADTLRKNADVALYEAKQAGRGQYCSFEPAMLEKVNERLSLSVQIDSALKNDEFTLHYQTVVDIQSGESGQVEALIRWRRPDGRLVSAAMFIPHAEETGLVKRIDAWVLERACQEVGKRGRSQGRMLRLSVNVSPASLQQPEFSKTLSAILARTNFPASYLILELTETAVIARGRSIEAALDEITALGVTITLDDFGTGYSALGALAKLPVRNLKIDRSIIDTMLSNPDAMSLVQTIISLAHSLNLGVVAEGVETEEQQSTLRLLRCDQMQGYLISKPVPMDDLTPLLRDSPAISKT